MRHPVPSLVVQVLLLGQHEGQRAGFERGSACFSMSSSMAADISDLERPASTSFVRRFGIG
jgi:hypothetical protein